jgi:hypothetical protein
MSCPFARLLAFVIISGCATSVSSRDPARDPANPRAPESPATAPPGLSSQDAVLHYGNDDPPPQTSPQAPLPASKASAEVDGVFTCPMHSGVQSNKPGTCPECGMKLIRVRREKP